MRVSELTSAKLDYWAAKAEERSAPYVKEGKCYLSLRYGSSPYSPSSDWSRGGPIIEREKISPLYDHLMEKWHATELHADISSGAIEWGETPLIAAMRCFVASKFGEEVPDEPTR